MRLLLSSLLLASLITPVNAALRSQEELACWLTYYYQKPEPAQIPDAIEHMSHTGWFDKPNSMPPIFGFLAGGFRDNPQQVSAWVDRLSALKESHLGVVVLGLWYANLPDSQQRVYALLEQHPTLKQKFSYLYKESPTSMENIPLEQGPWVLDALWGNFMATGSKTPVVRVMSTLPWIDVKGDITRLTVGGAARWSLTSNAVQHPRILDFCETEVATQPKEVAEKLREVVTNAKKELASGHRKPIQPTSHSGAADE
jgi:hypothetical protein